MEAALQAIAEPRRRAILRLLRQQELSAGDIASHFELTRPAVSQHLQILTRAGLTSVRRAGTRRIYRLRPEGLQELRELLEEFWDDQLAAIKQHAEAEEQRRRTGEQPTF